VHLGGANLYVLHLGQGAGLGDGYRQGGDAVNFGGGEQVAAGKAPGAIGDHAHAKALCAIQRQLLNDAVFDGDVLRLTAHDPDIGIGRSFYLGQVQSAVT